MRRVLRAWPGPALARPRVSRGQRSRCPTPGRERAAGREVRPGRRPRQLLRPRRLRRPAGRPGALVGWREAGRDAVRLPPGCEECEGPAPGYEDAELASDLAGEGDDPGPLRDLPCSRKMIGNNQFNSCKNDTQWIHRLGQYYLNLSNVGMLALSSGLNPS